MKAASISMMNFHFTPRREILFLLNFLSFLTTGIFSLTTPAFSGEIFDPFSRVDEYLEFRSDQEISKGDVRFYVDAGYLAELESRETRLVLTVSIPESELRFLQEAGHFFADYRVSLYWKNTRTGEAEEKVWERRFERCGEVNELNAIHTFRTALVLKGGEYKIEVEVEDRNDHRFGRRTFESTVPDLLAKTPFLSTIFLHAGPGEAWKDRGDRIPVEELQLKTLGLYPYASDRVAYYIEVYGVEADEKAEFALKVDIVDSSGTEIWGEERPLDGSQPHLFCAGEVGSKSLDLGEYMLCISLLGSEGRVEARREKPFYVSSSDRWLEDHFEFVLEFLRDIASQTELDRLKAAPKEDRLTRWREFWRNRDPLPATPINEVQVEFYRRLRYVNRTFTTHIEKGWSTDRGRVYLTLGRPDEVVVRESAGIFGTWQIWIYDRSLGFKVILYFEDRGFTDDYRLVNPGEFIRAGSRME